MRHYLAYVRVSSSRQSTHGVSLAEQRRAIERYALEHGLPISAWFEEAETAASPGRSQFQIMIRQVVAGRAGGLLIHKIDRGARNLRDWADLGELIDQGVDVRFVHDDLDLDTRGGRLSADIQAVIAADFVRNLREEVKKGIYGRLAEGLYPFAAPLGYLDRGGGRAKAIDPLTAPLVTCAFGEYAAGDVTLRALAAFLTSRGLRSSRGGPISVQALSKIFRNRFYVGEMVVRGQVFAGTHQALVSQNQFGLVQTVLGARRPGPARRLAHAFRYRLRLTCEGCRRHLVGERQKGLVYYRCHRCRGTSVREDAVDRAISEACKVLGLSPGEPGILCAVRSAEVRPVFTNPVRVAEGVRRTPLPDRPLQCVAGA